jgi:hypothetical protein
VLFAFKTVLSLLESDSGVTAYILTLVSDRSLTVSECSLSLYLLLDLIIIGGNADISRYFVPFNLSTCAVRLVRITIYWNWMWLQLQTVDHSVRWSMKNAASCVKRCEMQDTPSTWFSNAYCSLRSFLGLRLSEGRYDIKIIIQVCEVEYAVKKLLYSSDLFIHLTVWSSVSGLVVGCVLSFSSLTITAEHYTFCWSLTFCTISLSRGTYLRFMVADRNRMCCFNTYI